MYVFTHTSARHRDGSRSMPNLILSKSSFNCISEGGKETDVSRKVLTMKPDSSRAAPFSCLVGDWFPDRLVLPDRSDREDWLLSRDNWVWLSQRRVKAGGLGVVMSWPSRVWGPPVDRLASRSSPSSASRGRFWPPPRVGVLGSCFEVSVGSSADLHGFSLGWWCVWEADVDGDGRDGRGRFVGAG